MNKQCDTFCCLSLKEMLRVIVSVGALLRCGRTYGTERGLVLDRPGVEVTAVCPELRAYEKME
jgi:hypothetical protein